MEVMAQANQGEPPASAQPAVKAAPQVRTRVTALSLLLLFTVPLRFLSRGLMWVGKRPCPECSGQGDRSVLSPLLSVLLPVLALAGAHQVVQHDCCYHRRRKSDQDLDDLEHHLGSLLFFSPPASSGGLSCALRPKPLRRPNNTYSRL